MLTPTQTSLLTDQYELAMASSYLGRGMNETVVFELFVRHLPPRRRWLLAAGLGPALTMVKAMRFGEEELAYARSLGFGAALLEYLARFRFAGDIDAIPEGTIVFAGEPLVRVTAGRVEAQLLETLLLNQVNFQTMVATKAARIALAAGGGEPAGERLVDFSPRRDHGTDAAMKAARASAIAGSAGTSNLAAAMRYGLEPVGTMTHSYVMSFEREEDAFKAFIEDFPGNALTACRSTSDRSSPRSNTPRTGRLTWSGSLRAAFSTKWLMISAPKAVRQRWSATTSNRTLAAPRFAGHTRIRPLRDRTVRRSVLTRPVLRMHWPRIKARRIEHVQRSLEATKGPGFDRWKPRNRGT